MPSGSLPERYAETARDTHNGTRGDEHMNPRDDRASSRVPREQNTFAPKTYVPKEAPLSLGQMQHIAPKPFQRSKETIDLGEVRKILSSERTPGVAPFGC